MEFRTISEMFINSIDKFGPKNAYFEKIDGEWKSLTYQEVGNLVHELSAGLASLGIKEGDKIAILSNNCPRWALSDYAILNLGAASVTIYPTLIPHQIKYIIDDSNARFVITGDQEQTDKVLEFSADSPGLEGIISMDNKSDKENNVFSFADILEQGREYISKNDFDLRENSKKAKPDDLLTLIYTSGTTGNPKGVMLSHKNLSSNIIASLKAIEISDSDTLLSFLPLSHVFERMVGHFLGFSKGVTCYYAESIDSVAANMGEVHPTIMVAVPRLYEKINAKVLDKVSNDSPIKQKIFWWSLGVGAQASKLIQRAKQPTGLLAFKFKIANKLVFSKLRERVGGKLRFFVSGGAPLSKAVGEFFSAANLPILEGYGLTETSPVITVNRIELYKFGTVGKMLDGVEVKIAEDGEILFKGDNLMLGYYNNEKSTKEVIDEDGWFHTGDVGEFDEDNYLKITDRKKSLLVTSGGKNIAPAPLEIALCSSKYIEQALAIGDHRNFVSALIVPAFEAVEKWADENDIKISNREELCSNEQVIELIDASVQDTMESFAKYEKIKKFVLLPNEWTIESGETTPKLSVKRKEVEKNYAEQIDSMYQK